MARSAGSVYQRKDGRWVAALTVNGKPISRYAKTEEAAQQQLALLRQAHCPRPRSTTTTLAQWLDRWLLLSADHLRPISQARYREMATIVSTTRLGPMLLADLTPLEIAAVFAELRMRRGARVLATAFVILRHSLDDAVELGLLETNPMLRLRRKAQWRRVERPKWTREEAHRFLEHALTRERCTYGPLLAFLGATGLRLGEALALDWSNVNLAAKTIRVVATIVQLPRGQGWVVCPPKTAAGRREISLPDLALRAILATPHRRGPVFRTAQGSPPTRSFVGKVMRKLCAEAQVPYLNPHGLRHVHAMLVLETTKDIYAVQRRLGHANVNITAGVYGYSTRSDTEVSAALDKLWEGQTG